jgi:hypothetical protein
MRLQASGVYSLLEEEAERSALKHPKGALVNERNLFVVRRIGGAL